MQNNEMISARPYSPKQLYSISSKAVSFENRDKHGKDQLDIEFIGTLPHENRAYNYYIDSEGNYWYTVSFLTADGPVSEYEYIFGHKEKKTRRYKMG